MQFVKNRLRFYKKKKMKTIIAIFEALVTTEVIRVDRQERAKEKGRKFDKKRKVGGMENRGWKMVRKGGSDVYFVTVDQYIAW